MTPKEKADLLVDRFMPLVSGDALSRTELVNAKHCALIAVENEYESLRDTLFNLKVCRVVESDIVYLSRLQQLIDEESEIKTEIEKL